MDLASIAAYSASQHFRSHHFDIRNEPAQPSLEFKSFLTHFIGKVLNLNELYACSAKRPFQLGHIRALPSIAMSV